MADVILVDRKMKVQTEQNFQKTILDEIKKSKNIMGQNKLVLVFACYLIAYIIRIMKSKVKQICYSNDGCWRGNTAIKKLFKASGSTKKEAKKWLMRQPL